jgi:hypothetical protein
MRSLAPPGRLPLLLLVLAMAACTRGRPALAPVPVPDSSMRLGYDLPPAEAERGGALTRALEGAVCLVRKGSAEKCREQEPEVCDTRSPAQVQALRDSLRPAVELARDLELASALTIDTTIARRLPGARSAGVLVDARRATPCSDWGSGACAAFRYGPLWFLLSRGPGQPRPVERVELFLAGPPCPQDIRAPRS